MNCHDIGRGMDSVTQFVIKMYDAGGNLWVSIFKNTGLFHPDETSRWSTLVYSYHDKFTSAGSVTGILRTSQKK